MSTRHAVILVEVQIPSGEDCGEALSDVVSEIESGVQRTGLTYRVETNTTARDGRRVICPECHADEGSGTQIVHGVAAAHCPGCGTPQSPFIADRPTELAMRTILAIVKADTREFVTIDVCDTEDELAEAHAGIREGYTCEVFELTDRSPAAR